jgi:hypothetical protein
MNTDLDAALAFVAARIEEEAVKLGEPLTADERFLLQDLPKHSSIPLIPPDVNNPVLVPRNLAYEKLCALAKSANRTDEMYNLASAQRWEFAAAVSKLNRHPMAWLLDWAGVKVQKPWWDKWLLLFSALLFIAAIIAPTVLAGDEPWSSAEWVALGFIYVGALTLMYFGARSVENWQLRQTIERCRAASFVDE